MAMELLLRVVGLLLLPLLAGRITVACWWRPWKLHKHFREQGIKGPSFRPFVGNLPELAALYAASAASPVPPPSAAYPHHESLKRVNPHLHQWREKYGKVVFYWYGRSPRLQISEPDMIKEFAAAVTKCSMRYPDPIVYNLLGRSVFTTSGDRWARQRKLINPLFFSESIKGVFRVAERTAREMTERWSDELSRSGSSSIEIDVFGELEKLGQAVISGVIFGEEDQEEAMAMVRLQAQQSSIVSQAVRNIYIPGSRLLPTAFNRRSSWLRKEIIRRFKELIKKRELLRHRRNDWLANLLSTTETKEMIMEELSTFLIAGSDSTSTLIGWACLLLSIHTDWQERAREEIHKVLPPENGGATVAGFTIETLKQLSIMNMIINETMRLYTPVALTMKVTEEEVRIGKLTVPAGTGVEIPIEVVHHDPELWGEDVFEFDPRRFSGGVARATRHPAAFMPFMVGPRSCPGMSFALTEAKVALAHILRRFALSLSPAYKHKPVFGIALRPKHGIPLLLRRI